MYMYLILWCKHTMYVRTLLNRGTTVYTCTTTCIWMACSNKLVRGSDGPGTRMFSCCYLVYNHLLFICEQHQRFSGLYTQDKELHFCHEWSIAWGVCVCVCVCACVCMHAWCVCVRDRDLHVAIYYVHYKYIHVHISYGWHSGYWSDR